MLEKERVDFALLSLSLSLSRSHDTLAPPIASPICKPATASANDITSDITSAVTPGSKAPQLLQSRRRIIPSPSHCRSNLQPTFVNDDQHLCQKVLPSYCLRQVSQPHFYSLYLVQNQLDLNSLIFRSLGVPYLCRINRVIKVTGSQRP